MLQHTPCCCIPGVPTGHGEGSSACPRLMGQRRWHQISHPRSTIRAGPHPILKECNWEDLEGPPVHRNGADQKYLCSSHVVTILLHAAEQHGANPMLTPRTTQPGHTMRTGLSHCSHPRNRSSAKQQGARFCRPGSQPKRFCFPHLLGTSKTR